MRGGEKSEVVKTLPPETSPSVSSHRSAPSLVLVSLTSGSPLTMGPGCQCVRDLIFLIYFTDLNACFKNSYLKLGVSTFGEPNFVSFILKCSI